MTANDIIREATALLGYSDNDGNSQLTQRIRNRALPLFNLVYNDLRQVCGLKHKPIISLSDEIELPENAIDVLKCGVAGYLAGSEGDDAQQYIWMNEFQQRRTKLSRVGEIKDVIPTVD
ncbi:MAG: hypothetical protein J6B80_04925 [Clostridia bacterium]|nr:hypothetical protein [Clostridia bacterium]MBO5211253.1 hypothetical protein [Clostridia bacterium]